MDLIESSRSDRKRMNLPSHSDQSGIPIYQEVHSLDN
jgi:hypothetical protein